MVHHCRLTSTAFLHQVGAKVNSWPDLADPPDPTDPADQNNQVSLSAARSLPSTRAGGQDDVSFNKLPQINKSCKLVPPVTDPTLPLQSGLVDLCIAQPRLIGVRGLPARGIFFLGAMGLVPGQFGRFRLPPLKQEAFMFLKHTK